jgi:hypothetical protein
MRQPSRREGDLRSALQQCQSRQRFALRSIDVAQRHVMNEMRFLSIEQASALLGHLRSIELLLQGEVIS